MRSEARASKKRRRLLALARKKKGSLREHVDDEQPGLLAASFAHFSLSCRSVPIS